MKNESFELGAPDEGSSPGGNMPGGGPPRMPGGGPWAPGGGPCKPGGGPCIPGGGPCIPGGGPCIPGGGPCIPGGGPCMPGGGLELCRRAAGGDWNCWSLETARSIGLASLARPKKRDEPSSSGLWSCCGGGGFGEEPGAPKNDENRELLAVDSADFDRSSAEAFDLTNEKKLSTSLLFWATGTWGWLASGGGAFLRR